MTYEKRELLGMMREQLAVEHNCPPEALTGRENIITLPSLHEKRRRFSDSPYFFMMVTMGGNAVISADERLHDWLRGFIADKEGHWLFEHPSLMEIELRLAEYGKKLSQTYHTFLPKPQTPTRESCIPVKWFEGAEIHQFYEGKPFPNALCDSYNPERPDMLAVAAYDGNTITGMAGCSADTPLFWQIGIDVAAAYRGRGIGTHLVSLLKDEIIRHGKIPYYGTSLSNLHSWNIALNSGFYPVYVGIYAK